MKKLAFVLICLFVVGCVSSQKPRKILPEYKSFVDKMPPAMRVVKLAYPDSLVIRQMPDHFYVIIMEDGIYMVVAVDKKNYSIVGKFKIKIGNCDSSMRPYRRHFCGNDQTCVK
jgi:hypothetical protein